MPFIAKSAMPNGPDPSPSTRSSTVRPGRPHADHRRSRYCSPRACPPPCSARPPCPLASAGPETVIQGSPALADRGRSPYHRVRNGHWVDARQSGPYLAGLSCSAGSPRSSANSSPNGRPGASARPQSRAGPLDPSTARLPPCSPLGGSDGCISPAPRQPAATMPASSVHRSARDCDWPTPPSRACFSRRPRPLEWTSAPDRRLCQGRPLCWRGRCGTGRTGPGGRRARPCRSTDPQDFFSGSSAGVAGTIDVDGRGRSVWRFAWYTHSPLATTVLGVGRLPTGPWLQSLADGWQRIDRLEAPLRSALVGRRLLGHDAIHRAADFLVEIGAVEQRSLCTSNSRTPTASHGQSPTRRTG